MKNLVNTLILCALLAISANVKAEEEKDIQATTVGGEAVILHANGYWEYVDSTKAAKTKAKLEAQAQTEGCPKGTRPSFFGYGRCISIGDDTLKRGSLSGKGW